MMPYTKWLILLLIVSSLTACHVDIGTNDPGVGASVGSCARRQMVLASASYNDGCPEITELGNLVDWVTPEPAPDPNQMQIALRPLFDGHYPRIDQVTYRTYEPDGTEYVDLSCTLVAPRLTSQRVYQCAMPSEPQAVGVAFTLTAMQVSSETCFSTARFEARFPDSSCDYRADDRTAVLLGSLSMPLFRAEP